MSIHFSKSLKIATAWAAIGLIGSATGWSTYRSRELLRRRELIDHAKLGAVAFAAAEIQRLSGTRDDAGTPGYAVLKDQLRRLKAADPQVRLVGVFRFKPETGKVIVLGDSAEPGAKDEALPGDEYQSAPDSPGWQAIIRTGEPASEGPRTDDIGVWVSAYVVIGARPVDHPMAARHLLGLKIDAGEWRRALIQAAFERAVMVWVILGIPLGAGLVFRRQRKQDEVIHNLSEAMEQSHSAILITDREGRIEYVNRGLCQQNGYARREFIGRSWRDFQAVPEATTAVAEIAASIRAGQAWEGEWSSQRKDGAIFPVRGGFSPVKRRDGKIAGFVAVFDDVTEAKRREAELREVTASAQAGDRAKGQFLATMSHEVRTPLNGIVGFTNLLLETALTVEQREYVQTIHMSTEALIQLTEDILDVARIESGKLRLDPTPCDPRESVEDVLDLLAAKAAEKGLELLHRVDPDVPAAILVDDGRLRQVLVNLVGNAVKFTARGEIEVTVARAAENEAPAPAAGPGAPVAERCTLVFAVRDTGIGIPAEHHAKLFRAFSQIDESTTRRHGGTGLGLAISRNLVELMDGTISLHSQAGAGSTFTFSIRVPVANAASQLYDLRGLQMALAMSPGPLRRELVGLVQAWRGEVIEADAADALVGGSWQVAMVNVSADLARELAARPEPAPGWVPDRMIGLVPISISNEVRGALRRHFRLLVTKPIHHDTLFTLLSEPQTRRPASTVAATRFGFRVLVVEDNLVNQRLIKRVLESFGCTPMLVENGRQALEVLAARAGEIDLVLLDMHMPEMDGLTALRAIRAGEAGAQAQAIWVVALTADAREQQRTTAMEAGLNGYLTKPLNLVELEAALQRFRDEREGQ